MVIMGVLNAKKKGDYMKNKLKLPPFKNEDEERTFWTTHDFSDDQNQFEEVELDLSKLKPTTVSISLRLPAYMLRRLKEIANSRDIPYQLLMKVFLAERINKEIQSKNQS